jgi:excisionase family DNA binding protein
MPDSNSHHWLLKPNDVAELCQVSTKTVLRAIRAGRLPACRLGSRGAYRIRREDLDAWLGASPVEVDSERREPGTLALGQEVHRS